MNKTRLIPTPQRKTDTMYYITLIALTLIIGLAATGNIIPALLLALITFYATRTHTTPNQN